MKTILTKIIMIFAFCIILVSCKKDYTCTCTATVNIPGFGTVSADTTIVIENVKKKDAEKSCDDAQSQLQSQTQSGGGSASCSL